MRRTAALTLIMCTSVLAGQAYADEQFHRLHASEIRARLTGKVVTDESHWADKFLEGGVMGGHQLGQPQTGSWKLSRNGEICVVRKVTAPESDCFEIWLNHDQVQYRRGSTLLSEGVLRNE